MIALATLTTSLIGCGEMVYRTSLETYCPSLKVYPDSFNSRLADELELADEYVEMPYTVEALGDYRVLREKIKACRKAGKGVE